VCTGIYIEDVEAMRPRKLLYQIEVVASGAMLGSKLRAGHRRPIKRPLRSKLSA
jgi:hypothetical protein